MILINNMPIITEITLKIDVKIPKLILSENTLII